MLLIMSPRHLYVDVASHVTAATHNPKQSGLRSGIAAATQAGKCCNTGLPEPAAHATSSCYTADNAAGMQIKLKGRALLPLGVHDRTVVVHDNEPTSAVALCLSSR